MGQQEGRAKAGGGRQTTLRGEPKPPDSPFGLGSDLILANLEGRPRTEKIYALYHRGKD